MCLSWPLPSEFRRISQGFGERPEFDPDYYARWSYPGHPALDIACPAGTEVYAAHAGWTEPRYNWVLGQHIRVNTHDGSMMTRYSHLSQIDVDYGQHVAKGEQIGLSGGTGQVTGDHLDLALKEEGVSNPSFKDWLDPQAYLRRETMTKTSAHIQRIEPWMQQGLIDLGCNWVKCVNPPGGPDPMPRIPNKVVRIHTDAIDDQFVPRGEQGGRDFVRHMLPQWRERAWATCYSLANEPGCNDAVDLMNLNAYSIGAMEEASTNGIKLVILETSESNPTGGESYDPEVKWWKLRRLFPAVQTAIEQGHYVGVHAYWRPGVEGSLGHFHALGEIVTKVNMWAGMGVNLDGLQLLVTEWGLDGAIESHPHEGWRAFVARGVITERDYIDGLLAAEALAQTKPWLKALFKFTYGFEGQWQSYDHQEGFVRNLVTVMSDLPGPPVEPPAPPEELASHPFTSFDRQQAEYQFELHPATMKAANELGYLWQKEWEFCFFYFCLVYSPADHKYKVLKLDPQTWQVVAQIDL